jgi:hypothetical protein
MSPLFLSREIDGGGNTRPGVGAHRALGAAFRVQATLSKPGEVSVFSLGELVLGENPTPFGPEPNAFWARAQRLSVGRGEPVRSRRSDRGDVGEPTGELSPRIETLSEILEAVRAMPVSQAGASGEQSILTEIYYQCRPCSWQETLRVDEWGEPEPREGGARCWCWCCFVCRRASPASSQRTSAACCGSACARWAKRPFLFRLIESPCSP